MAYNSIWGIMDILIELLLLVFVFIINLIWLPFAVIAKLFGAKWSVWKPLKWYWGLWMHFSILRPRKRREKSPFSDETKAWKQDMENEIEQEKKRD